MNQILEYYSLLLDILCVIHYLTSITMPDPQTSDMRNIRWWCQRFLWHQLALPRCTFYV